MRTDKRIRQFVFLCAVAAILCFAYLMFQENPSGQWQAFFPKCMLYRTTGLHCPGCGCQRAIHHLLNGRLLLALQHNAMLIIALPWLLWEAVRASLLYLKLPVPRFMKRRWRFSGKQAMLIVVAVTAFWLLRNVPCQPFELLAPPVNPVEIDSRF